MFEGPVPSVALQGGDADGADADPSGATSTSATMKASCTAGSSAVLGVALSKFTKPGIHLFVYLCTWHTCRGKSVTSEHLI